MSKISARYQRTFQVKPYESETITLYVEEDLHLKPVKGEQKEFDARVKQLALAAAALHKKLAEVGDVVMAERVRAPDPRDANARRSGSSSGPPEEW